MKESVRKILGIRKQMMICRFEVSKNIQYAIIEPLSEEQEDAIEAYKNVHNVVCFKKNGETIAEDKNIILYGEVDFNNPSDIKFIKRFNLVDENGSWLYSNIDYDKGLIFTTDGKYLMYPTYDPIEWFKYCHLLIGKPKRIIVYKTKATRKYV